MLRVLFTLVYLVVFPALCIGASGEGVQRADHFPGQELIIERLEKILPGFKVLNIHPVGDGGLWEVEASTPKKELQVFYTDAQADILVSGNAFSLVTLRNITDDVHNRRRFRVLNEMPVTEMLRFGSSDGLPDVLYFTDPDCPYCQQFHGEFEQLIDEGLSVGVVFYVASRKHPDGERKSASVWCADDVRAAFASAMKGDSVDDAPASCLKPDFSAMKKWGERLGIKGTPGFVLRTGELVSGKTTASRLQQRLSLAVHQAKGE